MTWRMSFRISIVILLFAFAGCTSQNSSKQEKPTEGTSVEESLLHANKQAVKAEDEQIDNFLKRYSWKMEKTGTGLRYAIYYHGNGPKAAPGKIAVFKYSVRLINGNEIYNSDKDGLKEFEIGHGGVESGLEEGILLLRVGDKAKIVIPSHLGFGLLGDQDLVPPKSTLIYDLELVALK